jgi:GNAT superfamily N-acetyltransferase
MVLELRLEEQPVERLDEHASIPIAFMVERVLAVSLSDDGLGGIRLSDEPVSTPWLKDYDAEEGEGPTRWLKRFDTTNWGLIAAYLGELRVGGVVIAMRSPDVRFLRGQSDFAAIWDIRIAPEHRSEGIGSRLFQAAEDWSRERGCVDLTVETQNINAPACDFYVRKGCTLASIDRLAYRGLPEEVQLVWHKKL